MMGKKKLMSLVVVVLSVLLVSCTEVVSQEASFTALPSPAAVTPTVAPTLTPGEPTALSEDGAYEYVSGRSAGTSIVNVVVTITDDDLERLLAELEAARWDVLSDVLDSYGIRYAPALEIERVKIGDGVLDVNSNYGLEEEDSDVYIYMSATGVEKYYDVLLIFLFQEEGLYAAQKAQVTSPVRGQYMTFEKDWLVSTYDTWGTGFTGRQRSWTNKYTLEGAFSYLMEANYTYAIGGAYSVHSESSMRETDEEYVWDMQVDITVFSPEQAEIGSTSVLYNIRYDAPSGAFYDNSLGVRWYQSDLSGKANLRELFVSTGLEQGELWDWLHIEEAY